MAIPALVWTLPVGASPATTADSHKLNNDLVVVSDKFGTTGTFAPGGPNASKSGKYMVASAEYNSSSAQAKGGTASFGMTSLSSLNVGNVVVTGNISGVSANGMNIEVEFTSAFTSGLNNYEGCVMHYKVIGITPEYFQGWAATLD